MDRGAQQQRGGRGGGAGRGGRGGGGGAARPTTAPGPVHEVQVTEGDASITFESLRIIPEIIKALKVDMGYTKPTPIQQRAIPHVMDGKDVLAGAQTGTGKTAAFAIPILQKLFQAPQNAAQLPGNPCIKVLCLTPTRELAAQIDESFRDYGKHLPPHCSNTTVIFGGVGQGPQVTTIKQKRPSVLVATPGRLLDLHGQGLLNFNAVEYFVLDEADRMLDMGFFPDVSRIIKLLPTNRQTLLFSATFASEIRTLANTILRKPMAEVQVTPPNSTVDRIDQKHFLCSRDMKKEALVHIIKTNNWSQVLVFTRTKHHANAVAAYLCKHDLTALPIHGGKAQNARTKALADFKSGSLRVLVATDIAARGIDIEDLPHVVNYEIPNVTEDYVHRIGRTGRAGKQGYAVNLVSLDEEGFMRSILNMQKKTMAELTRGLPEQFLPPASEKAEPIAMGRQTIWGGLGPLPPRSVMDAAGKAARREIANNQRERKETEREAREEKAARTGAGRGRGGQPQGQPRIQQPPHHGQGPQQYASAHQGGGGGGNGGGGGGGGRGGGRGGRGGGGGGRGGRGGGGPRGGRI